MASYTVADNSSRVLAKEKVANSREFLEKTQYLMNTLYLTRGRPLIKLVAAWFPTISNSEDNMCSYPAFPLILRSWLFTTLKEHFHNPPFQSLPPYPEIHKKWFSSNRLIHPRVFLLFFCFLIYNCPHSFILRSRLFFLHKNMLQFV